MLKVNHISRSVCSLRSISCKALVYDEYGDPKKVLKLNETKLSDRLEPNQVLVKTLAATINPADINQVQGVYPIKPKLPAVGGNEMFAQIEKIGSGVGDLKVGDWVIPSRAGLGVWRTHANLNESELVKVDNKLPFDAAASFQVNPPTAYRMLKDFVKLKDGDLVVQNGGNSAVGRAVIQIARAFNLRTISVIRDRPNLDEVVSELKALGADEVFTEEQMVKESRGQAKNACLALNCVGGRSAMVLVSCLRENGVMVTYGGMSKLPIQAPTGPLIFKDVKLVGFWMSRWYSEPQNKQERNVMFDELTKLIISGRLKPPRYVKTNLENWKTAISNAMDSAHQKQMLIFS